MPVPGVDEALKAAAATGDWLVVVVVVTIVGSYGALAYLVKRSWDQSATREERMASRINLLEDYIRQDLKQAIERNTEAFLKFGQMCDRCYAKNLAGE